MPSAAFAIPAFSDVDGSAWYATDVGWTTRYGLMRGYADSDCFGVGEQLTRAEFAAMLTNWAGVETSADHDTTGLPDLAENAWYTGVCNWAVETGVITGYTTDSGTFFGPNDPVTREAAAVILQRWVALAGGDAQTPDDEVLADFPDASTVSPWARSAVAWAVATGVVSGVDRADGSAWLEPGRPVLREEAAALAHRTANATEALDSLATDRRNVFSDSFDETLFEAGVGMRTTYRLGSVAETAGASNCIVSGEVVGMSRSFMVAPVVEEGASPLFYTDFYVRVDETLFGSPMPSSGEPALPEELADDPSIITVRVSGGVGDLMVQRNIYEGVNEDLVEIASTELRLGTGDRCVFFLYEIGDGADRNAAGNHYYLRNGAFGVWRQEAGGAFANPADSAETLSAAAIAQASISPKAEATREAYGTYDERRAAALEQVEEEYRAGAMSQQAHDAFVAQFEAERSGFARILTPEEQAAEENRSAGK